MNFQTIQQNNGNLVQMVATVAEIGTQKLSSNNKPIQSIVLIDANNEKHKVTLYKGSGLLLTENALGNKYQFNLRTFQGDYKGQPYTGYSGFWDSKAQITSQSAQQAPQQAAQRPNGDQGKEMRIVRGNALNAVLSAADVPLDMIGDYLNAGVEWIMSGKWQISPTQFQPPTEQPASYMEITKVAYDDDMPPF
jgi:hypothetical protein